MDMARPVNRGCKDCRTTFNFHPFNSNLFDSAAPIETEKMLKE